MWLKHLRIWNLRTIRCLCSTAHNYWDVSSARHKSSLKDLNTTHTPLPHTHTEAQKGAGCPAENSGDQRSSDWPIRAQSGLLMQEEGVAPFVLMRVGLLNQQLCSQPVLQLLLGLSSLIFWEEAPPLFCILGFYFIKWSVSDSRVYFLPQSSTVAKIFWMNLLEELKLLLFRGGEPSRRRR